MDKSIKVIIYYQIYLINHLRSYALVATEVCANVQLAKIDSLNVQTDCFQTPCNPSNDAPHHVIPPARNFFSPEGYMLRQDDNHRYYQNNTFNHYVVCCNNDTVLDHMHAANQTSGVKLTFDCLSIYIDIYSMLKSTSILLHRCINIRCCNETYRHGHNYGATPI